MSKRLNKKAIFRILKTELSWITAPISFKSPENQIRLDKWARNVKMRDKRCQVCGSPVALEAHHLFYKSFLPQLAYSISNGLAACSLCHAQVHGEMLSVSPDFKIKLDILELAGKCNLI